MKTKGTKEGVLQLPVNACEQNFRAKSHYGYLRLSEWDLEFDVRKIEFLGSKGGL